MKKSALSFTVAVLIFTGTTAWLWHEGSLQRWIRAWVVEFYVRKLQPHLPFKIEEADVDANWWDFFHGKISRLSLVIHWEPYRLRLNGPIEILHSPGKYEATYRTQTTIENAHGQPLDRSTSFGLELHAGVETATKRLDFLALGFEASEFKWSFGLGAISSPGSAPEPRLVVMKPKIRADWDGAQFVFDASSTEFTATPAAGDNLRIVSPSLHLESAFTLAPLSFGSEARLNFRAESAEALRGEAYFDLAPLAQRFPLEVIARFAEAAPSALPSLAKLDARLGREVELTLEPRGEAWSAHWRLKPLKLDDLLTLYKAVTVSASFAEGFEIREGAIESDGTATLVRRGPNAVWSFDGARGSLRIQGAGVRIPKSRFAARGVEVNAPFEISRTATPPLGVRLSAHVSAKDLWFRRAHGTLKSTQIRVIPLPSQESTLEIDPPKLEIEGFPLRIGALSGKLSPTDEKSERPAFSFTTSLQLDSTPFIRFEKALCLDGKRIPPTIVSADFSSIQLEPGTVDPTGQIEARFFGGFLRLSEMGFYDLNTRVPELDFDALMEGIRLDLLGNWIGFGEMDGTLEAAATDVVFQSWLPTQYEFEARVKPLHKSKIVFSPDAMKNLVQLIAPDSMEAIPGVAQWMAFGWPSRVFGGYDVDYAGVKLHSADGTIVLETHDPPERLKKNPVHYILNGPRFKIPLRTLNYPLVLDATSMGNFTRQMALQLGEMARAKAEKEKAEKGNEGAKTQDSASSPTKETPDGKSDELPADCSPPQF